MANAALKTEINQLFGNVVAAHKAYYEMGGPESAVKRAITAFCERLDAVFKGVLNGRRDIKNSARKEQEELGEAILAGGEEEEDLKEAGEALKGFWKGYDRYREGVEKSQGREREVAALQMLEEKIRACSLLARGFGGATVFAAAAAAPAGLAIRAPSIRVTPSAALRNSARRAAEGNSTPDWGYEMPEREYRRRARNMGVSVPLPAALPAHENDAMSNTGTLSYEANNSDNSDNSNNNTRSKGYRTPEGKRIRRGSSPPSTPRRAGPSTPLGQGIRRGSSPPPVRRVQRTVALHPESPARAGTKRKRGGGTRRRR